MSSVPYKSKTTQKNKKKPPPRPPPPNFSKYRSKSTFNLNKQNASLIEWSPPNSPTVERTSTFGGSVSSSFSSSTSSLASSKKSFEYDMPITNNLWPVSFNNSSQISSTKHTVNNVVSKPNYVPSYPSTEVGVAKQSNAPKINIPSIFGPTIIRARPPKNKTFDEQKQSDSDPPSPPMPSVPPPSPPKEVAEIDIPYGVALYDYQGTDLQDLSFHADDIIILLRRINDEWLFGRALDKEGMFPANFIDIKVPLAENNNIVTALYEFNPQMTGDLRLKPGQSVKILRKINDDWLYGESNGQCGQFPANFVNRIPNL